MRVVALVQLSLLLGDKISIKREKIMQTLGHFIDGRIVKGSDQKTSLIYDPAHGRAIRQVALAQADDLDQAINSAKKAFPLWSAQPPAKRARVFFNFKTLIEKDRDHLAALVSEEHGKTLDDARGSIQRGLELVEYVCGIPGLLKGDYSENVGTQVDSYSLRQPLGICAGIAPFNFPAMIPLWMFPMATACGNTFILKPSEKVPSCAMRLAELFFEAGAPAGVLNVLNGDRETVDRLLTHEAIASISFVGSSTVAEHVYKTGTQHGKRVQAFGSAKNHAVVMPDADLEQTAEALIGAAYGSSGQRCMAISVAVVVGEQRADELVAYLKPHIEELKIGSGADQNTQIGPVISQESRERIERYLEIAKEEGATIAVGGRYVGPLEGFFVKPALFDHVKPSMRIYREEIFGPTLCIVRVADYEQALALVNANEYGNGVAIFTQHGGIARDFAARVQVGMVGINVPIPVPVAYHSFGGWKRSVFGDTRMHAETGIDFYTKTKTITSRWPTTKTLREFSIPTLV